MRQGKARAAVSDAFVSMGSVFLSVCGKDVLASCSEDPIKKKKKSKLILPDLSWLSSFSSDTSMISMILVCLFSMILTRLFPNDNAIIVFVILSVCLEAIGLHGLSLKNESQS